MAFDKDLDKELFSETVTFDKTNLVLSVYSYNGGKPKLQITRNIVDSKTKTAIFTKLGRLSKEELEAIVPIISKAMGAM